MMDVILSRDNSLKKSTESSKSMVFSWNSSGLIMACHRVCNGVARSNFGKVGQGQMVKVLICPVRSLNFI